MRSFTRPVAWAACSLVAALATLASFPSQSTGSQAQNAASDTQVVSQPENATATPEVREDGALRLEGIPAPPPEVRERMLQYLNTRSAGITGWSAVEGGMYVSTRFGETYQTHHVSAPGAYRRQVTFFDEPVSSVRVSPSTDNPGFLFLKDTGGSEYYQVFWFDTQKASSKMLTDGASRNGNPLWNHKGDAFAYYSTRFNDKDWGIWISTTQNPEKAELVHNQPGFWIPVDFSPDDSKLLILSYHSANDSEYHILDLTTGSSTQVNPQPEDTTETIYYGDARWDATGKGLYLTSDEGTDFVKLRHYDLETRKQEILTGDINWSIDEIALSPDGGTLAFVSNEDGINRLYLLDTRSRERSRIENLPMGVLYNLIFNHEGDKLGFSINSSTTPGDAYALDLQKRKIERWTFSETGGLPEDAFTTPELIRYPTFDLVDDEKAREIPAFYYKPKGEGPHPVIVYIHGGPEGQFQPYFVSTFQYWVNELGVAVIAPNVRGSTGYGKHYLTLDNVYQREDSVKDIGKLLDWIDQQPELDTSRIMVYGGSYGGYMSYASMVRYNQRLKAGVSVVGISDFVTFLTNTKEYRQDLRRIEYGDERIEEVRAFLKRISPLTNAHCITRPMLIGQGANDPRVPVTESDQMARAIRQNGADVWYFLARNEGHGFRKKENADMFKIVSAMFIQNHLL